METDAKFWYIGYHTLFYLDYYLSNKPEKFLPPGSFTLSEIDPTGVMPNRAYSKDELLSYLGFYRHKCHDLIAGLTVEGMTARWINKYRNYSILEILLYNMTHVQHHAAQLNLLLRKGTNNAPDWVSQTNLSLEMLSTVCMTKLETANLHGQNITGANFASYMADEE